MSYRGCFKISSSKTILTYEKLIELSQENISKLEFDISNAVIPYSKILKPVKKKYNNQNSDTIDYIKKILIKEL